MDALTAYEHWHRYFYALGFVKGKVVIDVACGEGYGSNLLAHVARRVIGVDSDSEIIEHARCNYLRDNLSYQTGLATEIGLPERTADVVVSFETLEHLEEGHQKLFVNEVRRVLKDDGLFIISSPNKLLYSDIPGIINSFHKHELYEDEFKKLLTDNFDNVHVMGQKVYVSSFIWTEESVGFWNEHVASSDSKGAYSTQRHKEPLYFIAVCSHRDIKAPRASVFLDAGEGFLKATQLEVAVCKTELRNVSDAARIAREDAMEARQQAEIALMEKERAYREAISARQEARAALMDRDRASEEATRARYEADVVAGDAKRAKEAVKNLEYRVWLMENSVSWRLTYGLRFIRALQRRCMKNIWR
jgi:SAM-dependent methyltransferase